MVKIACFYQLMRAVAKGRICNPRGCFVGCRPAAANLLAMTLTSFSFGAHIKRRKDSRHCERERSEREALALAGQDKATSKATGLPFALRALGVCAALLTFVLFAPSRVSAQEIKLRNTADTCNAANTGALRYNNGSSIFEQCNGASWLNMGAGASGWTRTGTNVYTTTATDNVGIGTSVPLSKLDLVGAGTTSATASLIIRNSANTAKVTVLDNGSVGIGTSNPSSTFYVQGNNVDTPFYVNTPYGFMYWNGYSTLRVTDVTSGSSNLELDSSSASYPVRIIAGMNGSQMLFGDQANNTNLVIDNASRNIGISSSAPQAKLDVEGSVYFGNGNIGVGSSAPSQALDVTGTVKATAFIGDGSGITGITGTSQWTTNGTSIYYNTGNVGIGSASPASTFNISAANTTANVEQIDAASLTSGQALAINGPSGGTAGVTSPLVAFVSNMGITGYSTGMIRSDATVNSSTNAQTNHVYVKTTNAPTVQNQIIGTYNYLTDGTDLGNQVTGIQSQLSLSGNASKTAYGIASYVNASSTTADTSYGEYVNMNITGAVTSGTQAVYGVYSSASSRFVNGGTANVYGVYSMPIGSVTSGTINAYGFYAANGFLGSGGTSTKYGLYIAPQTGYAFNYGAYIGSNVGIGSSAPTQALDVLGTVKATAFIGDGSGLTGLPSGGGWTASGSNVYTTTSSNNVGIGTSVPLSKLDLVGAGTTSATAALVIRNSALAAKVTVLDNGNVGIGPTNPGAALEVAGNIIGGGATTAGASADRSIAFGSGNYVNGWAAAVFGQESNATGSHSFAAGWSASSSGDSSIALGRGLTASADSAIAIGLASTASAADAVALGEYVHATAANAFAIGQGTGSHLTNNTASSMMIGFNSNIPTLFIGPSSGDGTTGNVGIGSTNPASVFNINSGATTTNVAQIDAASLTTGQALIVNGSSGGTAGSTNPLVKFTSNVGNTGSSAGMISSSATVNTSAAGTTANNLYLVTTNANTANTNIVSGIFNEVDDNTALANSVIGINNSINLNSNAAKTAYGVYSTVGSMSTTADTAYGGYFSTLDQGSVAAGTQNTYGVYAYPRSSSVSGGTANLYGVYSKPQGTVSAGVINLYGFYAANGTTNTNGTSTKYGLYVAPQTGSTNNYGAYIGSNVGIGSTAPQAMLDVEGSSYFGNGNIGVGSSAPSQKVDVIGTVKATAFIGDGSGLTGLPSGGGWTASGTNVYTTTSSNNVGIGTSVPLSKLDLVGAGTTSTTFSLIIRDSTKTATVTVLDNGNVGIGTTSPAAKLDVVNGVIRAMDGTNTSPTTGKGLEMTSTSGKGYIESLNRDTVSYLPLYIDANALVLNNYSAGNVGIGTAIPSQKVDVIGTVKATAFIGDGSGLTGLPSGGGWTASGANVYTTTSSNNVGIGSSVPLSKLDIIGAGTTSATSSLVIRDSTKAAKVTVLDNGNIGIGTSVPIYKLQVSLEDAVTNNKSPVLVLEHTTTGTAANGMGSSILFMAEQANGTSWGMSTINSIYTDATAIDTALTFETRLGGDMLWERMRISANGNVGIGTTSPSAGLDVESALTATSLNLNGVSINPTLTAYANSTILTGLSINPTFTDGSYTPVTHYGANIAVTDSSTHNDFNYGLKASATSMNNAAKNTFGIFGYAGSFSTTADTLYGGLFQVSTTANPSSGTRNLYGVYATVYGHNMSGGTDNFYGVYATHNASDSGAADNVYALYAANGTTDNTMSTVNKYGLYIEPQTGATNNYGAYIGSNVGIGTTAPEKELTVYRASSDSQLKVYGGSTNRGYVFEEDGEITLGKNSYGLSGRIEYVYNSGLILRNTGADPIIFLTNGTTELARFTGWNDDVTKRYVMGIGTSDPGARLHVKAVGSGTGKAFQIDDSTSAVRMVVQDNGNVGIGSVAPQAKLDVEGSVYVGNGNVGIGVSAPTALLDIETPSASVFGLKVGYPAMGYVQMGAWVQNMNFDGLSLTGQFTSLTGYTFLSSTNSNNYDLLINRPSNFDINFQENAVTQITIKSGGNVGINSTAPQAKLDVEGSAYFGNGNIGVGSSAPSQKVDVIGTVKATAFIGDGSGLTGITGGSSQWTTNGTSIYYNTGNVGIGSTNPGNALQVYNASAAQAMFNGYSVDGSRVNPDSGSILFGNNTSYQGRIDYSSTGNTTWNFDNTYDSASAVTQFRMRTTGTPVNAMTILGNGNVSIGSYTGSVVTTAAVKVWDTNKSWTGGQANFDISTTDAYGADIGGSLGLGGANSAGNNYLFGLISGRSEAANGYAGYLQFSTVTALAAITQAMRITSNGNVGIGTTAPGDLLTVSGAGDTVAQVIGGSSNDYTYSGLMLTSNESGTVRHWKLQHVRDFDYRNQLRFDYGDEWGNWYSRMAITTGGNVGIGTTLPGSLLSVNGGVSIGTAYASAAAAPANGLIVAGNVGIGTSVPLSRLDLVGAGTTSATASLVIRDSNKAAKVTVLDNGNVGIGTTTPLSVLSLYSNSAMNMQMTGDGVDTLLIIDKYINNATGPFIQQRKARGTLAVPVTVNAADTVGNNQFWAYDGTAFRNIGAFKTIVSSIAGTDDIAGAIEFLTRPAGVSGANTERMRIDSAGNVGIGTTAPATLLDLGGGTNYTNTSYQLYAPTAKIVQVRDASQSVLNLVSDIDTDSGTVGAIAFTRSGGNGNSRNIAGIIGTQQSTGASAGGMLQFWTKSTASVGYTNMVITNDGNVGIGTMNPMVRFQVGMANTGTSGPPVQIMDTQVSSAAGYPVFVGGWFSTAMWGIGPYSANNDSVLEIGPAWWTNTGSNPVGWYPADTDFKLYVDGKVGIGTASPGVPLDIGTNISMTVPNIRVAGYSSDNANGGGGIEIGNASGLYMRLFRTNANNFEISTNPNGSGSGHLLLMPYGNVGIGSTNPEQALVVIGSARFSAVGSGAMANDLRITSDGTLTTNTSDASMKTNLVPLNGSSALNNLMQLKPYTFSWIADPAGKRDYGFVAQDMQAVFPEVVFVNPVDGKMGINYSRLPVVLTSAIQELKTEHDRAMAEVAQLRDEVKRLRSSFCKGHEEDDACP